MVDQTFVDKLKHALEELVKSRGSVSLFAALKMDDITDKWSIIVIAPWVHETTFDSVFNELRGLLIKSLGEEMSTVARIGIFDLTHHFSKLMVSKYETGDVINSDQQVNGNLIHSGYIIYANKNAHSTPNQSRLEV